MECFATYPWAAPQDGSVRKFEDKNGAHRFEISLIFHTVSQNYFFGSPRDPRWRTHELRAHNVDAQPQSAVRPAATRKQEWSISRAAQGGAQECGAREQLHEGGTSDS